MIVQVYRLAEIALNCDSPGAQIGWSSPKLWQPRCTDEVALNCDSPRAQIGWNSPKLWQSTSTGENLIYYFITSHLCWTTITVMSLHHLHSLRSLPDRWRRVSLFPECCHNYQPNYYRPSTKLQHFTALLFHWYQPTFHTTFPEYISRSIPSEQHSYTETLQHLTLPEGTSPLPAKLDSSSVTYEWFLAASFHLMNSSCFLLPLNTSQ